MPDNSNALCNVVVQDLDASLTYQDFFEMFSSYGEIKSAKLAVDPNTGESRGYGFVWFTQEQSAQNLIRDSEKGNIAFRCSPYKNAGYRKLNNALSGEYNKISVKGYPSNCGKNSLSNYFSHFGEVESCHLVRIGANGTEAHITFKNVQSATRACLQSSQRMFESVISVTPIIEQSAPKPGSVPIKNNLFVQNISKKVDEVNLRKLFAQCGQISSMKLVRKSTYPTDIAYVAFKNSCHAQFALKKFNNFSLDNHPLSVQWHKTKEDLLN